MVKILIKKVLSNPTELPERPFKLLVKNTTIVNFLSLRISPWCERDLALPGVSKGKRSGFGVSALDGSD